MNKRFAAVALSALLAGSVCAVTGCDSNGKTGAEKQAYVSLDINPAIELIVDKDSNVVSVRGENEDGQVLLYEETGIKGEKIDAAVQKITDLAVKYGFLDEENRVVDTIVTSGDNGFAAEIMSKVDTTVTATAANSGLTVTVDGEGAYSLLRKMDEVKKQFPDNKAVQNMSVHKFKLALSVSETGDVTIDAAARLDDAELIDMLKESSSKIEEFATAAYTEAKTRALAAYEQATELAGYGVYMQFYIEKALTHPLTAYYGGVYQMYASAAKGFDVICDVAEFGAKARNYPLNDEQIAAVVAALGMESDEALRNSDGNVTVDSIEAYADKLFKNSPASDALNETKAALTQALSQVEAVIGEKVDELGEEYKPQIEAAKESARRISDSVESAMSVMPESIKTVLDTAAADLKEILTELDEATSDGDISIAELRAFADRLDEKANEYLNKITADLTDEEQAELERRKAAAVEKLTAQKQAFEKALNDAEKSAKDRLSALKESLKNANK